MNRESNTVLSKTGGLGDLGLTITDLALAAKARSTRSASRASIWNRRYRRFHHLRALRLRQIDAGRPPA